MVHHNKKKKKNEKERKKESKNETKKKTPLGGKFSTLQAQRQGGTMKTLLKPSLPIQSTAEAVSHHFSDSLVLKNLGRIITSGSTENKIILYDYEG